MCSLEVQIRKLEERIEALEAKQIETAKLVGDFAFVLIHARRIHDRIPVTELRTLFASIGDIEAKLVAAKTAQPSTDRS